MLRYSPRSGAGRSDTGVSGGCGDVARLVGRSSYRIVDMPTESGRGVNMGLQSQLDQIRLIDTDSHLTEAPDLWTSRAPSRWADLVPRVMRSDGDDFWVVGSSR